MIPALVKIIAVAITASFLPAALSVPGEARERTGAK